jgi:uncharacterized DUF497 family protein
VYTATLAPMILWDEPKRDRNQRERKLDFADLTEEFFATAITYPAKKDGLMAIGEFRGKVHCVIFRPLGSEAVSVISMRRASRKERKFHETRKAQISTDR